MQIQLKQQEITAALKGYIAQQGISLSGKEINITFTAGRKESGISAEITIEDLDMPDFTEEEIHVAKLTVIPTGLINRDTSIQETAFAGVSKVAELVETPTEPEVAEVPAAKTTSLFS